ncbi:hypothetical protein T11_6710 [Trichinella zimbabwensis]|uniref:Uncharacterized protein n=1 Tax=Trichinella zimbabwensis TaxID=268475 RepID=A0A0V1HR81_9BILA|nr:hypothetical protein T11_6710 [Trichinella zimbabwensis]
MLIKSTNSMKIFCCCYLSTSHPLEDEMYVGSQSALEVPINVVALVNRLVLQQYRKGRKVAINNFITSVVYKLKIILLHIQNFH